MIVVDASAVLAIYLEEADGPSLRVVIARTESAVISPVNLWEILVRAERLNGAVGRREAEALVVDLGVEVVDVDHAQVALAADAFARFGGRPARLNLGDCFAYALAKSRGAPLLFKGGDFAATDISAA